jgi:hypothetical protein
MNNIHEKDWAEDDWGGHSGMCSNPYGERGDGEPASGNAAGGDLPCDGSKSAGRDGGMTGVHAGQ